VSWLIVTLQIQTFRIYVIKWTLSTVRHVRHFLELFCLCDLSLEAPRLSAAIGIHAVATPLLYLLGTTRPMFVSTWTMNWAISECLRALSKFISVCLSYTPGWKRFGISMTEHGCAGGVRRRRRDFHRGRARMAAVGACALVSERGLLRTSLALLRSKWHTERGGIGSCNSGRKRERG